MAGVVQDYPVANNHFVARGRFITDADVAHATDVCVIGPDLVEALFPHEDASRQGRSFSRDAASRSSDCSSLRAPASSTARTTSSSSPSRRSTATSRGSRTVAATPFTSPPSRRSPSGWIRPSRKGPPSCASGARLRFFEENDFALLTPRRIIEQFEQVTAGVYLAMILDLGNRSAGGGRGGDEHHARLGDRADPRDRLAQGRRRPPERSSGSSSCWRRPPSPASAACWASGVGVARLVAVINASNAPPSRRAAMGRGPGLWRLGGGRLRLRRVSGHRAARLDPVEALHHE